MHHRMCKVTVIGEQQKTTRIDVQTTNRNPAAATQFGQMLEHRGSILFVGAGGYHPFRLVIRDQLELRTRIGRDPIALVGIPHPITLLRFHTQFSRVTIQYDQTGLDIRFELAP